MLPEGHCTRLNEPRGHTAAHARTEHNSSREQGLLSQQLGPTHERAQHHQVPCLCSKQVQKDSSPEDEEEEQASPCVKTTERCCWHQDVGRGGVEGYLQEDGGGGSPEGGRVLEGPAVQHRG